MNERQDYGTHKIQQKAWIILNCINFKECVQWWHVHMYVMMTCTCNDVREWSSNNACLEYKLYLPLWNTWSSVPIIITHTYMFAWPWNTKISLAIFSDSKIEIFGPCKRPTQKNKFDIRRKLAVWSTIVN